MKSLERAVRLYRALYESPIAVTSRGARDWDTVREAIQHDGGLLMEMDSLRPHVCDLALRYLGGMTPLNEGTDHPTFVFSDDKQAGLFVNEVTRNGDHASYLDGGTIVEVDAHNLEEVIDSTAASFGGVPYKVSRWEESFDWVDTSLMEDMLASGLDPIKVEDVLIDSMYRGGNGGALNESLWVGLDSQEPVEKFRGRLERFCRPRQMLGVPAHVAEAVRASGMAPPHLLSLLEVGSAAVGVSPGANAQEQPDDGRGGVAKDQPDARQGQAARRQTGEQEPAPRPTEYVPAQEQGAPQGGITLANGMQVPQEVVAQALAKMLQNLSTQLEQGVSQDGVPKKGPGTEPPAVQAAEQQAAAQQQVGQAPADSAQPQGSEPEQPPAQPGQEEPQAAPQEPANGEPAQEPQADPNAPQAAQEEPQNGDQPAAEPGKADQLLQAAEGGDQEALKQAQALQGVMTPEQKEKLQAILQQQNQPQEPAQGDVFPTTQESLAESFYGSLIMVAQDWDGERRGPGRGSFRFDYETDAEGFMRNVQMEYPTAKMKMQPGGGGRDRDYYVHVKESVGESSQLPHAVKLQESVGLDETIGMAYIRGGEDIALTVPPYHNIGQILDMLKHEGVTPTKTIYGNIPVFPRAAEEILHEVLLRYGLKPTRKQGNKQYYESVDEGLDEAMPRKGQMIKFVASGVTVKGTVTHVNKGKYNPIDIEGYDGESYKLVFDKGRWELEDTTNDALFSRHAGKAVKMGESLDEMRSRRTTNGRAVLTTVRNFLSFARGQTREAAQSDGGSANKRVAARLGGELDKVRAEVKRLSNPPQGVKIEVPTNPEGARDGWGKPSEEGGDLLRAASGNINDAGNMLTKLGWAVESEADTKTAEPYFSMAGKLKGRFGDQWQRAADRWAFGIGEGEELDEAALSTALARWTCKRAARELSAPTLVKYGDRRVEDVWSKLSSGTQRSIMKAYDALEEGAKGKPQHGMSKKTLAKKTGKPSKGVSRDYSGKSRYSRPQSGGGRKFTRGGTSSDWGHRNIEKREPIMSETVYGVTHSGKGTSVWEPINSDEAWPGAVLPEGVDYGSGECEPGAMVMVTERGDETSKVVTADGTELRVENEHLEDGGFYVAEGGSIIEAATLPELLEGVGVNDIVLVMGTPASGKSHYLRSVLGAALRESVMPDVLNGLVQEQCVEEAARVMTAWQKALHEDESITKDDAEAAVAEAFGSAAHQLFYDRDAEALIQIGETLVIDCASRDPRATDYNEILEAAGDRDVLLVDLFSPLAVAQARNEMREDAASRSDLVRAHNSARRVANELWADPRVTHRATYEWVSDDALDGEYVTEGTKTKVGPREKRQIGVRTDYDIDGEDPKKPTMRKMITVEEEEVEEGSQSWKKLHKKAKADIKGQGKGPASKGTLARMDRKQDRAGARPNPYRPEDPRHASHRARRGVKKTRGESLSEATPAEKEALTHYHDSIKQDAGDLKKNYRAVAEFAMAVSHIDRAAKDGGPMVRAMRKNRLGMVKNRAGAKIKMMADILSRVNESVNEQLDVGQAAEGDSAAKAMQEAGAELKKAREAIFKLTTANMVQVSSMSKASGMKRTAGAAEAAANAASKLLDDLQNVGKLLDKANEVMKGENNGRGGDTVDQVPGVPAPIDTGPGQDVVVQTGNDDAAAVPPAPVPTPESVEVAAVSTLLESDVPSMILEGVHHGELNEAVVAYCPELDVRQRARVISRLETVSRIPHGADTSVSMGSRDVESLTEAVSVASLARPLVERVAMTGRTLATRQELAEAVVALQKHGGVRQLLLAETLGCVSSDCSS